MQPTSCIADAMQVYGSNATTYREPPTPTQIENGVIPLDSLPADWWNWLWYSLTTAEATIVTNLSSVFNEIISVLTAAGKTPSGTDSTQLLESIRALCAVVATTTKAGSVLSSTTAGELNVDGTTGKATINCLGNPASLETTNKEIVSAINEVLTITGDIAGKAPIYHASSDTTYGIGGGSGYINNCCIPSCFCKIYGHVALTNDMTGNCCWCSGLYTIPGGIALSAGDACIHFRRCGDGGASFDAIRNCPFARGHVAIVCGNGLSINEGIISMGNATISPSTYPGACCTGTVTSVKLNGTSYSPTSGVVDLGSYNGLDCTGTVTGVKFNGTIYSGTGVVDIGSITGFPGYGNAVCSWDNTCSVGTSTCVARADHRHGIPWSCCCLIAIGCSACVPLSPGSCSIAIGYGACSFAGGSIAIGSSASVTNTDSIAIGDGASAHGTYTVAIGCGADTYGTSSIAVGCNASAYAGSTSIGACTIAGTETSTSANSVALGICASSCPTCSIAIGYNARACYTSSIAIGECAISGPHSSVTIGAGACYYKQEVGSAWIASNWMGDILLLKWYGVIQNCVLAKHLYTALCRRYGRSSGGYYMGGSLAYCTGSSAFDAGGIGFFTCPLYCCTNSAFIKMFIRTGQSWYQAFSCTSTANTCYMDASAGYGSALLHVYYV